VLGQPVTIGDIRVSVLPIPALVGGNIRVGTGRADAPALAIERIRFVPRLRSLLSRPIVIEEIRLEGLLVAVLRDRAGRWLLPAVLPAPTRDSGQPIVIERVTLERGRVRVFDREGGGLAEAASIDDVSAVVATGPDGMTLSPIRGRIGGAALSGNARLDPGAVRMDFGLDAIADADLTPLLRLAGTERPGFLRLTKPAAASLSTRIDRSSAQLSGAGSIRAPEVGMDSLRLDRFEAPVAIKGTRLTLAPTTFALYGGEHRGTIVLDLSQSPVRWTLDSRVQSVDVGDFLAALTSRDQRLDGTGDLSADLRGLVGEPLDRTVQGRAAVTVTDGVVRQFALLAAINRALRLAEGEGADTRFQRLSATLSIADGYATTRDLVMVASDVRVEAAGRIGFDRSLDLTGQAVLSPERTASAVRSVKELAALRNAAGELELPLRITGTADDPAIAVDLVAAAGRSLAEELRRRLRGIIRK
jgi:uncharacterized protein YhdP